MDGIRREKGRLANITAGTTSVREVFGRGGGGLVVEKVLLAKKLPSHGKGNFESFRQESLISGREKEESSTTFFFV